MNQNDDQIKRIFNSYSLLDNQETPKRQNQRFYSEDNTFDKWSLDIGFELINTDVINI